MAFQDQTIWIIGASSGIGEALARMLADHGATLILSARRKDKLLQLQHELGDRHHVLPFDIADEQAVITAVTAAADCTGHLHRVIVMAGTYNPAAVQDMDTASARNIMNINFMGPLYVSKYLLPVFNRQQQGQLALCASVAGYIGLPNGQPYSASKAALINFAESLYNEVSPGIDIKLICPGFVRTPLTDMNTFNMPMIISADAAAKAILHGLQSRRFEIHFPRRLTLTLKCIVLLPYAIKLRICKTFRK